MLKQKTTTLLKKKVIPEYSTIRLANKPIIDRYFANYPQFSEFIFSNLYNWRVNGLVSKYRMLHRNIVIKTCDVASGSYNYWLIGSNRITDCVRKLLENHKKVYIPFYVYESNQLMLNEEFNVFEDETNHQYIYDVEKVIEMKGNKLEVFRRNVKKFIAQSDQFRIKIVEDNRGKKLLYKNLSTLFASWYKYKSNGSNDEYNTFFEFDSLKQYLVHSNIYDLSMLLIYKDEELVAFSTIEIDKAKNIAYVCYAKSNLLYKGLSEFTFYKTAEYVKNNGVRYLDYEQDLGIENLRRFKRKLAPAFLNKAYIVTAKS